MEKIKFKGLNLLIWGLGCTVSTKTSSQRWARILDLGFNHELFQAYVRNQQVFWKWVLSFVSRRVSSHSRIIITIRDLSWSTHHKIFEHSCRLYNPNPNHNPNPIAKHQNEAESHVECSLKILTKIPVSHLKPTAETAWRLEACYGRLKSFVLRKGLVVIPLLCCMKVRSYFRTPDFWNREIHIWMANKWGNGIGLRQSEIRDGSPFSLKILWICLFGLGLIWVFGRQQHESRKNYIDFHKNWRSI